MLAFVLLSALAAAISSCAYYNTFYLARKYYFKATLGQPYEVDRATGGQGTDYSKSIDYSKKLLGIYPKSKYVPEAWLLWGKALIGRDDPLQTISMLQDFETRFPKSPVRAESQFFLGLAYRNARKYAQAVDAFTQFVKQAPKHELVPYAYLERARALVSLELYDDAANSATEILDHYPGSLLVPRARRQRAEARFQKGDYDGAREDFHQIELAATSDDERFLTVMREMDCFEAARRYDDELVALRAELAHTPPPPPVVPGTLPPAGSDKYGKLTLRVGTAELLQGKPKDALEQFNNVLVDYPKSALSAEAQYRIGYVYETGLDDFDRATQEYAKVKEQFGQTPFTDQAQQRTDNLARIQQYRQGTGADSLEKKAEAGFLTAELYLFQLDKPERAFDAYGAVVQQYPGTAVAGRALNAQAWVLSRKLHRKEAADSLFWKVVHEYPATEAQLAARDYLEMDSVSVPESLIVPPKVQAPPAPSDTLHALPKPPAVTPALGVPHGGALLPDSLRFRPGHSFMPPGMPRDSSAHVPLSYPPGALRDTSGGAPPSPAPDDSTRRKVK